MYAHIVLVACNLADCAAAVLVPHFSAAHQCLTLHPVGTSQHHKYCLTYAIGALLAWVFSSMQYLVSACLQRELSQTCHHTCCDFRVSACLGTECHASEGTVLCRQLIRAYLQLCAAMVLGPTTVVLLNGPFACMRRLPLLWCCQWDVLFFNKLHSPDPRRH